MEWFDTFFDRNYNRMYFNLTDERTCKDADFIQEHLELKPEDEILDLPCGFGRHFIELSRRGFKVTGMEYNQPQIDQAKELMAKTGVNFEIIQADMRKIHHKNRYDKIYNFFTSFGYFSDEENEKVLGEFYSALKPGGLFLVELVNRDAIIKNFIPSLMNRRDNNEIFLEERKFDPITGRNHFQSITKISGYIGIYDD